MLQNGLIILTFVWSLMRMVNISHDYWQVWWLFHFPSVNCSYLSSNIPESHAYGGLFHSGYVLLGFVRNMKIFCSDYLFWFQSYWSRDIFHGNFRLRFWNSMVVIQTMFTTVTYDWFPVILGESRRVPHVGQEMLTLSGTPAFTPFREFTISPIHYNIHYRMCQSKDYVYGLMTYLCAWISLIALICLHGLVLLLCLGVIILTR